MGLLEHSKSMKIRLAGDPNTRYDNERHDKRFEHIFGAGSGHQGGDDTEEHGADSYFRPEAAKFTMN
jgi:hypothetical protein